VPVAQVIMPKSFLRYNVQFGLADWLVGWLAGWLALWVSVLHINSPKEKRVLGIILLLLPLRPLLLLLLLLPLLLFPSFLLNMENGSGKSRYSGIPDVEAGAKHPVLQSASVRSKYFSRRARYQVRGLGLMGK
jgi:hypothetical protein